MTAFIDFLWSALPILGFVLGFILVIVGGLLASAGARQGLRDRARTGGSIFAIGVLLVLAAAFIPPFAEPLGQAAANLAASVLTLVGDSFFGAIGTAMLIFVIVIAAVGAVWIVVRLIGIAVAALFLSLYAGVRET